MLFYSPKHCNTHPEGKTKIQNTHTSLVHVIACEESSDIAIWRRKYWRKISLFTVHKIWHFTKSKPGEGLSGCI